eukprot:g6092.t1
MSTLKSRLQKAGRKESNKRQTKVIRERLKRREEEERKEQEALERRKKKEEEDAREAETLRREKAQARVEAAKLERENGGDARIHVVEFPLGRRGFTVNKVPGWSCGWEHNGNFYHSRVSLKAKSGHAQEAGVRDGWLILGANDWDARNCSAEEVKKHINDLMTERPFTVKFLDTSVKYFPQASGVRPYELQQERKALLEYQKAKRDEEHRLEEQLAQLDLAAGGRPETRALLAGTKPDDETAAVESGIAQFSQSAISAEDAEMRRAAEIRMSDREGRPKSKQGETIDTALVKEAKIQEMKREEAEELRRQQRKLRARLGRENKSKPSTATNANANGDEDEDEDGRKKRKEKKDRDLMTEAERLEYLLADTISDEEVVESRELERLAKENPIELVNPMELPVWGVSLRFLRKYAALLAWQYPGSSKEPILLPNIKNSISTERRALSPKSMKKKYGAGGSFLFGGKPEISLQPEEKKGAEKVNNSSKQNNVRKKPTDPLTTKDMIRLFVIARTISWRCSIVDMLRMQGEKGDVGVATHFVTHCHDSRACAMPSAVENYFRERKLRAKNGEKTNPAEGIENDDEDTTLDEDSFASNVSDKKEGVVGVSVEPYVSNAEWDAPPEPAEEDCYLWIDIFSLSQHEGGQPTVKKDWLTEQMKTLIGGCHSTILVFDPWRKPLALKYSQNMFEIMSCIGAGRRLSIQLSEMERSDFDKAMIDHFEEIARSFSHIDCKKSKPPSSDVEVAAAFQAAIVESWGHVQVDISIKKAMRAWLAAVTEERMDELERTLGCSHKLTLHLKTNMALLLQSRRQYDSAEKVLKSVLKRRKKKHGAGHKATISTQCMIAWLNKGRARHNRATGYLDDVYQELLSQRGANHDLTVTALQNVAAMTKALAWDAMGAGWRSRKKGDKVRKATHAELDKAQEYLDQSKPKYEAVLESRKRLNGPSHTLTRLAQSALEHVEATQTELDKRRADLIEFERLEEERRLAAEESDEELIEARKR